MSPGGHLVTTAAACAAVYGATGSPALTAGLAAGGFLIDVDHAVDYVLFERQRDLRLHAFLRYYLGGQVKRTVLLLHSYEVAALLALVAWASGWQWLWGYLLGMALHLPLDIVFNGKLVPRSLLPFYSVVYRWRAGFRASALLGPCRMAPASPSFWGTFFKGAVAIDAPGIPDGSRRQPTQGRPLRAVAEPPGTI